MIRKCRECGLNYPHGAGHICPGDGRLAANDNKPWCRTCYMRDYMAKYREQARLRVAAVDGFANQERGER